MKKLILSLTAALALTAATQAGEYQKAVVTYKTVTVNVEKVVSYDVEVVKYDHCGKTFTACETRTKVVCVPVTRTVAVTTYVTVCY